MSLLLQIIFMRLTKFIYYIRELRLEYNASYMQNLATDSMDSSCTKSWFCLGFVFVVVCLSAF